jgi:ribonuclease G
MQAAFIDVGLERTAFLHAADIATPICDNTLVGIAEPPDIKRLVHEGDDILVQVVKDPMGTKGARLTTFVALPSRLMVYMPRGEGVGVSARIEDEAERARLKALVSQTLAEEGTPATGGGYIVRTAAQGADAEAIREDMKYLCRLWQHVREKGLRSRAGELVYEDLPLPTRILRDELARGVDLVLVDNAASHAQMLEFAAAFMPISLRRKNWSSCIIMAAICLRFAVDWLPEPDWLGPFCPVSVDCCEHPARAKTGKITVSS